MELWPLARQVAAVWTRWEPLRPGVRPRRATWRYYILTGPAAGGGRAALSAAELGSWVRGHWGVENGLHYVLDESLGEDRSRTRSAHGAGALCWLRRVALGLLRDDCGPWPARSNIRQRQRTLANAPDRLLRHLQRTPLHLRPNG